MLNFDFKKYNNKFLDHSNMHDYDDAIDVIKRRFIQGDLSYWLDAKTYIKDDELSKIKEIANYVRNNADVFVVIGIGGSYMGSKAIIEALSPMYDRGKPEIIFLGKNLNPNEYVETLNHLKDKEIVVNVISKSGNTLEPSIAFDLVYKIMKQKYGEDELQKRVIITTDEEKGKLRELVNIKGYTSLVVPTIIGGRYSVFTPVGMLPIVVSGIDVDKLLIGVRNANNNYFDRAVDYAVVCDVMYKNGKEVESFTIYDEKMMYLGEWLKQLLAESHGKEGKGLLPIVNINTRDLHSMGQYLQDGKDIIFETVLAIKNNATIQLDDYSYDLNGLNNMVVEKVCEAHQNGHTPSSLIWLDVLNEENLGELMQFFMLSTIVGGLLLGINPFDQPGVQEYKNLIMDELNK